jgi:excisionase family DNA binding protein
MPISMSPDPVAPAFYTITETAKRLSCSRSKIWSMLRAKMFTSTHICGTAVIPVDQVEAYVADRMAKCAKPTAEAQ